MNIYENLNALKNSVSVCLIGHISPDADALSSMVVLRDFLIDFFNIETVDLFAEYESLSNSSLEILDTVQLNPEIKKYDTAIMIDSPNLDRLGIYKTLFENSKLKIVIDHHKTNENLGDINIVEMKSSTCEIIYTIIKSFNKELSVENQGKIYAGILTDTNNLTVGNFNNNTFKIISEIIDNINYSAIYNAFLGQNSLQNMQLLAMAINNITTYQNGQIIITHISHHEAEKFNVNFDSFTGIINKLATITGNQLVCFIYPKTVNTYYVSMRAKEGLNVATLAKNNNGGGHEGAAAFLTEEQDIDLIKENILHNFTEILNSFNHVKNKIFK